MLKKRSRPVKTNQALMNDYDPFSIPSPTSINNYNYNKPLASPMFPLSPRVFAGFAPKGGYSDDHDNGYTMSPTSILETKLFTPTTPNPFHNDKSHHPAMMMMRKPFVESTHEHEPVGLGIVDELKKPAKPESRMVLFGSQLKIQIPTMPNSPIEFGVKTRRNSHVGWVSPDFLKSPMATACLSASEMEMSEEYTCVIAHGPNPRTIHIFENCIVESCGDGFVAVTPRQENRVSDGLLTSCDACKMKLGEGNDIFIYKGEKAFCSRECRDQGMLAEDDEMEDCSL